MNERIRWRLPRETDIVAIGQEELDELASKMNRCPRKCLNYATLKEAFFNYFGI